MIDFFSENDFQLQNNDAVIKWLTEIISSEKYTLGELSFVFCSDAYLHKINLEFLNHDTLTDIISFDYSLGNEVHGEVYISTDRIEENAQERNLDFDDELHRVMAHGVLHLCGFKDKTEEEGATMRLKEEEALELRSVFKGLKDN